jgi:hypothetical protein
MNPTFVCSVRYFLSHPSRPRWFLMMPLCSETAARCAERTPLHESSSFSKKTRGQERAPPQTRPAAPKRGVAVSVGARRWENHARNWAPRGALGPAANHKRPNRPDPRAVRMGATGRGKPWSSRRALTRALRTRAPPPQLRGSYVTQDARRSGPQPPSGGPSAQKRWDWKGPFKLYNFPLFPDSEHDAEHW